MEFKLININLPNKQELTVLDDSMYSPLVVFEDAERRYSDRKK
jgi:hypothetical protein